MNNGTCTAAGTFFFFYWELWEGERTREGERERDGERKVRKLCRAVDLQTETVCSGGSASLSGCSDSRCFGVRVWFGMVSREC